MPELGRLSCQPEAHAFATDGSDQLEVTAHHEQGPGTAQAHIEHLLGPREVAEAVDSQDNDRTLKPLEPEDMPVKDLLCREEGVPVGVPAGTLSCLCLH